MSASNVDPLLDVESPIVLEANAVDETPLTLKAATGQTDPMLDVITDGDALRFRVRNETSTKPTVQIGNGCTIVGGLSLADSTTVGQWSFTGVSSGRLAVSSGYKIGWTGTGDAGISRTNEIEYSRESSGVIRLGSPGTADGGFSIGRVLLTERSSDPGDPAEGRSVLWQSDGTGSGDDGDILMKVTAGGVTKTATLVDFSAV